MLLVGNDSGKLAERIKSKCRKNELEDAVVFTGIRNDVADLMQAMDVFVLPSLYDGVPVTMIEAQAAGLPCVVSENVPKDCVITGPGFSASSHLGSGSLGGARPSGFA